MYFLLLKPLHCAFSFSVSNRNVEMIELDVYDADSDQGKEWADMCKQAVSSYPQAICVV